MLISFAELSDRIFRKRESQLAIEIGKKAMSLIELIEMKVPVPDGWCILSSALKEFEKESGIYPLIEKLLNAANGKEETKILNEISQIILLKPFPKSLEESIKNIFADDNSAYAVRSSGSKEDLHGASFAGQYTSILNVRGSEAIIKAVRECWTSLFANRVFTYSKNKKIDFSEMALSVIIQQMIPSEKSGVVFTVNPVTAKDTEMLIEAVFGLGEALVGGEVTPDQYFYDWYSDEKKERNIAEKTKAHYAKPDGGIETVTLDKSLFHEPVLSHAEKKLLVEIALKIQSGYGFPVDIEWFFHKDKFYIVQSRPITTINYNEIGGQWTTADFKDGGVSSSVCSQFMWSLYDFIWEKTMPEYIKSIKITGNIDNILWGNTFFGRPYWNALAVKNALKGLIGYNERHFDEDLGITVGYVGDGFTTKMNPKTIMHGLRVLMLLEKSFSARLKYDKEFVPKQLERIREIDAIEPEKMGKTELYHFFEKLIKEDYWLTESSYFFHIFDNSNVQTLFKDSLKKYKDSISFLNLVIGLRDLSHMLPNYELWDISRKIKEYHESTIFWANTDVPEIIELLRENQTHSFLDEVRVFLKKYQYHSTRELDITIPNYREDPTFVLENLKHLITLGDDHNPRALNEKQRNIYLAEREKLIKETSLLNRSRVLKKLDRMRQFLWWREELRDVSSRSYDQVRRFTLALATHLKKDGFIDDEADIFFFSVMYVVDIINGKVPRETARAKLWKNKKYFQSFKNFTNPPDIGFDVTTKVDDPNAQSFSGIPCSSGVIKARARVIKDIFDAGRLSEGDILITKFTDPGWTPVFSMISGVVTETGGVLSHAAVIAREYGIPAVLAVKGITEKIHDGQIVTIDGAKGKIYIS